MKYAYAFGAIVVFVWFTDAFIWSLFHQGQVMGLRALKARMLEGLVESLKVYLSVLFVVWIFRLTR